MTKKEPCKIEECPINTCDNKYVWKDKLFNGLFTVSLALMLGAGATIFGMGQWKTQIDINIDDLNEQMIETKIEINEIKRSINTKLDTLLERTK